MDTFEDDSCERQSLALAHDGPSITDASRPGGAGPRAGAPSARSIAPTNRAQGAATLRRTRQEAPRVQRVPRLDLDTDVHTRLTHRILAHLPSGRLSLTVTDNRQTMISVKRETGPLYRVRLHKMFLDAPPHVTRALARYIALHERKSSHELSAYIDSQQDMIRHPPPRRANELKLRVAGAVFHLQDVFDDLNERYFAGAIDARITWGQKPARTRRRTSIKMGSYSVEERLIRIHPALDRDFVPRFFLEWIVYHEMLHQVHDIPVVGGRRRFHTPAFVAQERQFEHYRVARRWERQNLDRFLSF